MYSFAAKGTIVLGEHTLLFNAYRSCLLIAVFLVVVDESAGRSVPFVFLERLKDDFKHRYGGKDDSDDDLFEDWFSIAYNLDKEFGPRIKEHMDYCSNHPDDIE